MMFSLFPRQNMSFSTPRNNYNTQRSAYNSPYQTQVPYNMGGRSSVGSRYGHQVRAPCSMSFRSSGYKSSGGGG